MIKLACFLLLLPIFGLAQVNPIWKLADQQKWQMLIAEVTKKASLLEERNENTETLLMIIAGTAPLSTLKKALNFKPSLEAKTATGATALSFVVAEGKIDAAKLLLKAGASTNWKDADGWNLLAQPVREGNIRMIELLIKNNPDLLVETNGGKSLFDLATQEQQSEVAKWLKDKGSGKSK